MNTSFVFLHKCDTYVKYFLNLNPDDMLLLPWDKGHIVISQFTPTAASLFEPTSSEYT